MVLVRLNDALPLRTNDPVRAGKRWRVTGPGVEFGGVGRRGYLTLPPIEIYDAHSVVTAFFGGNRRIAPTRHVLTSPDGRLLATFGTRPMGRVVDRRRTIVTDDDGDELCTLVPFEAEVSGIRDTVPAASPVVTCLPAEARRSAVSGPFELTLEVVSRAGHSTWPVRPCNGPGTVDRNMSAAP